MLSGLAQYEAVSLMITNSSRNLAMNCEILSLQLAIFGNHELQALLHATLITLPTSIEKVVTMSSEIVPTNAYLKTLKDKYKDLDIPAYKLREWFSTSRRIFFDCESRDKNACLEQLLERTDLEAFVIFFVVRESSGSYRFMDASFRNLGTETLEHFVNRFHKQLEAMTRLGVQATGLEYMECIGHSYKEHDKEKYAHQH